jgi:hypothetical protein
MKPSKALLLSIFITAIILIVVGGVTSLVLTNNKASAREVEYSKTGKRLLDNNDQYH